MSDVAEQPAAAARASSSPIVWDQAVFDASRVDLSSRLMDKQAIEQWIPHRGNMSLLDAVVWMSDDKSQIIGIKHNTADEFWVEGHFPDLPLLPGVLMVEATAQLMCAQYNMKVDQSRTGLFTRIENCAFRQPVTVGDDLYLLVKELKFGTRRFQGEVQGWANGKMSFDATLSGMIMLEKPAGQNG